MIDPGQAIIGIIVLLVAVGALLYVFYSRTNAVEKTGYGALIMLRRQRYRQQQQQACQDAPSGWAGHFPGVSDCRQRHLRPRSPERENR